MDISLNQNIKSKRFFGSFFFFFFFFEGLGSFQVQLSLCICLIWTGFCRSFYFETTVKRVAMKQNKNRDHFRQRFALLLPEISLKYVQWKNKSHALMKYHNGRYQIICRAPDP